MALSHTVYEILAFVYEFSSYVTLNDLELFGM